MSKFPAKKPNRLKGYDYSQNGAYFVTICAKDHAEMFSVIGDVGATVPGRQRKERSHVRLTKMGQIINTAILNDGVSLPPL
jgi:hypothetical protein